MCKIKLTILTVLSIFASSCTVTDEGEFEFTWVFWVLLGVVVFSVIMAGQNQKKTKEEMQRQGINKADFVKTGHIIAGHPDVNEGVQNSLCKVNDDNIQFYRVKDYSMFDMDAEIPLRIQVRIPINEIEDISIEDKTTIENKITVGRIFLVGIFALGWKKKKVNEQAFLVIKWKTGKFVNETIFMFEEKGALSMANTARNYLIKKCSQTN